MDQLDKPQREMNGPEKKSELARQISNVQQDIRTLQTTFSTMTPMAKQLTVWHDIEKLMRAAEKVKAGFQELIL